MIYMFTLDWRGYIFIYYLLTNQPAASKMGLKVVGGVEIMPTGPR